MKKLILSLVLIVLLVAGACWYFLGTNAVPAAELLPADTVVFTTIPNGATVLTGYETSKLKALLDAPNSQPLINLIRNALGEKNVTLLQAFLPNLSGQSFIALTHIDPAHPEHSGLIAGLKPKMGFAAFDDFIAKLKTSYPDEIRQGTTGKGSVAGVDYEWIQGPGAPDKVCVAKYRGWIITSWGEASLQDWIERIDKKSTAPNLEKNPEYQKALERVGKDSLAFVYVNYPLLAKSFQTEVAKTHGESGRLIGEKLGALGTISIGTKFENGEIEDRFVCVLPRAAQTNLGLSAAPCPFDTLKFTGRETCLYWGTSIDWKQFSKNLANPDNPTTRINPLAAFIYDFVQKFTEGAGLDFQKNIFDPLGPEVSVQVEWAEDATYPEIGLLVKLDKPDDFKPTIDAILATAEKTYGGVAQVKQMKTDQHNFAVLKFLQSSIISPTITQDGPYLGLFLTETQAVRAFEREEKAGLIYNKDYIRQIGDRQNGASQIVFINTPVLLDRGYRTAMPYISILSMFSQKLGSALQGQNLPPDLAWMAPVGTWSFVLTQTDEGVQGYSISGIGNQGIYLMTLGAQAVSMAESFGYLPQAKPSSAPSTATATTNPVDPNAPLPAGSPAPAENPTPTPTPDGAAVAPTPTPTTETNAVTAPAAPDGMAPAPSPDSNADHTTSPTPTPAAAPQ